MGNAWARIDMHNHWRTAELTDWIEQGPYREHAMISQIQDIPKDARILDVGCGPGHWLDYLAENGYTNIEGLDVNYNAFSTIRNTYPRLISMPFHGGAAEDVLSTLRGPYDLITTKYCLQQLHPDSMPGVCDEIARLTNHLVANEGVNVPSGMAYTHDYEALFAERGMRLVSKVSLHEFPELDDDNHVRHNDYFFWTFRTDG